MRLFGLLLLASACTLENPAFFVTDGASGDPTRPTATSNTPTAPGTDATSEPPATTSEPITTGTSTGGPTSDPPATATSTTVDTTTDPTPMTASSSSSSGDDTDPVACGFLDVTGPLLPALLLPNKEPLNADQCAQVQMKELTGKLYAGPGGFQIETHQDCPSQNLPGQGFAFNVLMPDLPVAQGECVKLELTLHPDQTSCLVSSLMVKHQGSPVLVGSFGRANFGPEVPFQLGLQPTGTCACPDCCAPGLDPDLYRFVLPAGEVAEGQTLMFEHGGKQHVFSSIRAHVHAPPECTELPPPEWQHLDWLAIRVE